MNYAEKNLMPNEQILYSTSRHWVIFIFPILLSFSSLFFLTDHSLLALAGYILLLLSFARWIFALVKYIGSEYLITNKRILIKTGVIRRDSYETLLPRVAGIQVTQSAWGRLLNYGNVIIYGLGGEKEKFIGVTDPLTYRRKVLEQMENHYSFYDQDIIRIKTPLVPGAF